MKLLLAPHNDDECLYCSYTILRENPLVVIVTDSEKHLHRYGITAEQRRQESINALAILGVTPLFLGIKDTLLNESDLERVLSPQKPEMVYSPAIQGGNDQHDLVGRVALKLWGEKVKKYATYTKTDPFPHGDEAVIPTEEEIRLKNDALSMYTSQLRVNGIYFTAVRGRPEWFVA